MEKKQELEQNSYQGKVYIIESQDLVFDGENDGRTIEKVHFLDLNQAQCYAAKKVVDYFDDVGPSEYDDQYYPTILEICYADAEIQWHRYFQMDEWSSDDITEIHEFVLQIIKWHHKISFEDKFALQVIELPLHS